MVGRSLISLAVLIVALAFLTPLGAAEGSPTAVFDVNSDRIVEEEFYNWKTYVGEEVVLYAGQSQEATTYRWYLGDGQIRESELSTISYTYSYTGVYMIVLEVEDDEGNTDTQIGHITVVDMPSAQLVLRDASTDEIIDPSQDSIPIGNDIILDASGSQGELVTYFFGFQLDRAFIPQVLRDSPKFRHSYSDPGVYRIGLRVVDTLGNLSQIESEDFIQVLVVEKSDLADEEDSPPASIGDIAGIFLFIGVIGTFIMAFRRKSDPNHSWGSTSKDVTEVPEGDGSPFYFKSIRESEEIIFDPPSFSPAKPSYFESTITDQRSSQQGSYSDFRKP